MRKSRVWRSPPAGSEDGLVRHTFVHRPDLRVTLHPASASSSKPTIRITVARPEHGRVTPDNGSESVLHVLADFDAIETLGPAGPPLTGPNLRHSS